MKINTRQAMADLHHTAISTTRNPNVRKLATYLSTLLLLAACGGSDGSEANGEAGAAGTEGEGASAGSAGAAGTAGSGGTHRDGGPTGDASKDGAGAADAAGDDPDAAVAPPTPGGAGTLRVTDSYDQYLALKWEAASDGVTSPDALEYRLYYSQSANIDTVANVLANGTPVGDWTAGLTRKAVTEVAPGSTYHYNVLVRNAPGSEAAYVMMSATSGTMPFPVVDGPPSSIAVDGNHVYVAGGFDSAGPPVVGGVILDSAVGDVPPNTLPGGVSGRLQKVIPDGQGGWFIFGKFTRVHEMERDNAAHLAPDGVLHDWAPEIDGDVIGAALSGSTVYIGGKFSSVGGMPRNNLAAIDADTGTVLDWNPDVTSDYYQPVKAIAVNGTTVYVGGNFTAVGGQARKSLAAIDAITGIPTGWNPGVEGSPGVAVNTIVPTDTLIYVGGFFDTVAGQPRRSLAAISPTSGNPTSWAPNPDGGVYQVSLVGPTLFFGGYFSSVGGLARAKLAAVSVDTGQTTAWNPGVVGGSVYDLVVSGSTVYVGGLFQSVGGQPRINLAAVDSQTGNVMSWNPSAGGEVSALAATDSRVYVGGLSTLNAPRRNSLAAINVQTGTVTAWDPGIDVTTPNTVWMGQLVTWNHTLYVGGRFETAAGQARNCFAAFDTYTHSLTSWNPGEPGDDYPELMTIDGTDLYVAGRFRTLSGQSRYGLASFHPTGELTGWQPGKDGWGLSGAYAMETVGTKVYLGGHYVHVGTQSSSGILAVDKTTGAVDTAFPEFEGGMIRSMAARGTTLYVAGYFKNVGGQARNGVVAIDTATKTVAPWNPNVEGGSCESVAVSGSTVYLGGSFRSVGGQARNLLAAVDATTGAPASWNPDVDNLVTEIFVDGSTVYVGGHFERVGVKSRAHLAAVDAATGIAQ